MKLEPVGKTLIVEECEAEQRTSGGLLLVTKAKKDHLQVKVAALSVENPLGLTVGEKLIIGKYTFNEVQDGEKTYLVIKFDDILARIKE